MLCPIRLPPVHNRDTMPSLTWSDILVSSILIGSGLATEVLAPEFLKVVLPAGAAVLIVYVWATRGRHF
jgi:hypothetical protein